MSTNNTHGSLGELDPVYRNSRREAVLILISWAVFMIWCVGYCSMYGYAIEGDSIKTVLGMPSWVFWGIALPWMAGTVWSVFFGLAIVKDEPLGEEHSSVPADQEAVDE